jgi:GntR family transcriptional regulator
MNDLLPLEQINGIPVFVQTREKLREEIIRGKYQPGEQLPSEDDLALRFNISRMTMRRSMEELVKEGLLYRRHGRGTFVAHRRIDRDHSRLVSFFEEESREGRRPSQEIHETLEIAASHKIAAVLDLKKGEPVIYIRLLQLSNNEPITLLDAYIPKKVCPELLSKDLAAGSIWQIIEKCGYTVRRALQHIEARVADRETARQLKLRTGDPILYKERTVFTDSGMPLEYIECFNRGDVVSVTTVFYR